MPNTIVHFGLQATVLAGLNRKIGLLWIYTGCLLPDLPWIGQRVIRVLSLPIDPYDLRLYCVAQSSLFFCLILAAAIALLTSRSVIVLAILAGNSLLHLLMDAWQIKWGNGVVLFAPVTWRVQNWGLFWPESPVGIGLTIVAAACVAWQILNWSTLSGEAVRLHGRRVGLAVLLCGFYLVGPLLVSGPAKYDAHYTTTLRNHDSRSGKTIALDRVPLTVSGNEARLESFAGESIRVAEAGQLRSGIVSVRGGFVSPAVIRIDEVHYHIKYWRNIASVLALSLFLVLITFALMRRDRA